MGRAIKYLIIALVSVVLIAVLAAASLAFWIDPNIFKDDIEKLAAEQGLILHLDGDLSWQVFPNIQIVINGASLATSDKVELMSFDTAELSVALMPLLNKDIVVQPDTFLRNVQQELSVEPVLFANKKNKFNNKTYITVGLAASFVVFSVLLSKVDLLGNISHTPKMTASTDTAGKHNQQLALEKLQQEAEVIEEDRSPAVRFVTFEK